MKDICKMEYNERLERNNPNEIKIIERILDRFKTTEVGRIKILEKEYILKKEYRIKEYKYLSKIYEILGIELDEYEFYKRKERKIKRDKLEESIQIPYKYKICEGKSVYLFKRLDYDLNSVFLRSIRMEEYNNILEQVLIIVYYINHKLKIYHNDLYQGDKIRNIMVRDADKKREIRVGEYSVEVGRYGIVIIDFGLQSKEISIKNEIFYKIKMIEDMYIYEIKSELLHLIYKKWDKFFIHRI